MVFEPFWSETGYSFALIAYLRGFDIDFSQSFLELLVYMNAITTLSKAAIRCTSTNEYYLGLNTSCSSDDPGQSWTYSEVIGLFRKSSDIISIPNLKKVNNLTNFPLGFV